MSDNMNMEGEVEVEGSLVLFGSNMGEAFQTQTTDG